jgi:hypothetical protein
MESVRALMDAVLDDPTTRIVVDLEHRSVTAPDWTRRSTSRISPRGGCWRAGRHRLTMRKLDEIGRVRVAAPVLAADGLTEPSPERRSASSRVDAVSATSASECRTATGTASRSCRAAEVTPRGRPNRARISATEALNRCERRRASRAPGAAPPGHARLVAQREHVAIGPAPHLLTAGCGRLACRELEHRAPSISTSL